MLLTDVQSVHKDQSVRLICCQETHVVLVVGTCDLSIFSPGCRVPELEILIILVQWDPHPVVQVQIHLDSVNLDRIVSRVYNEVLVVENVKADQVLYLKLPYHCDAGACDLVDSESLTSSHGEDGVDT